MMGSLKGIGRAACRWVMWVSTPLRWLFPSHRLTALLRLAAVVSMALMTAIPIARHEVDSIFLHGDMSARSVNQGVTWFWVSWACAWFGFAVPAFAARHFLRGLFAAAVGLIGVDVIRIRMDFFAHIVDPDASGTAVYVVRFVAGWFALWYLNFHRRQKGDDAEHNERMRREKV